MDLDFITLDVFTDKVFKGNPLAIVTLPPGHDLPQAQKQAMAREFNLSETVFLHDSADETSKQRRIDIFTVDMELPFAGHPTVGSAVAVRPLGITTLLTKAGAIVIDHKDDNHVAARIPHNTRLHANRLAYLQPPVRGLSVDQAILHAELNAPVFSIVKGMAFVLTELPSLELLGSVVMTNTEFRNSELLDDGWQDGFVGKYYFVKTGSREEQGAKIYSIRTRMMQSDMEDPATGSAACGLCSYLALQESLGGQETLRVKFEVTQGVEMGRESNIVVEITVQDDGSGASKLRDLFLGGTARTVMTGKIRLPEQA